MPSAARSSCTEFCSACSRFDMKLLSLFLCIALASAGTVPVTSVTAARIKDLVSIEGVRENQLIGYGLVVGLAGTGDRKQTMFSAQSLTNLLERMGVSVN